jgi:hypothetical protein
MSNLSKKASAVWSPVLLISDCCQSHLWAEVGQLRTKDGEKKSKSADKGFVERVRAEQAIYSKFLA